MHDQSRLINKAVMMKSSSLKTIKYFAGAYPSRTAMMVAALVLAGVLEGVGLIALLPLITIVTGQNNVTPPQIETIVKIIFSLANLQITLGTLLTFLFLAIAAKALLSMIAMNQVAYAAPRVGSELRLSLLRSILNARWTHFSGLSSGAVANALGTEALRSTDVYRQACNILAYSIMIVVYTILAIAVSWQVTFASVLASYIIAQILHPLVRWARAAGESQTKLYSESLKRLADVVTGIKPVKAMARENSYSTVLEGLTENLQSAQRKQILNEEALRLMSEPLMVLFLAIGMFFALNYMSIASNELFFLAFLFSRLVARTMNAQRLYQAMVINESALWSLRNSIDLAEKSAETFTGTKQPSLEHAIIIDRVSFSYGATRVLNNISISFSAHRLHAILGQSGTGKTTLIDLITGLHRPQSGTIKLDGVSLDEIDIRAWRSMIGYVPQEVILFQGSILYNVTMGNQTFTIFEVERALRAAGIWDFIQSLPEGVESIVGERGTKLSGGQRQRIAIARAIIHMPKLLILDEATSALDIGLEESLFKTVRELSQTMTVIAISHKPSIREQADQVFEFNSTSPHRKPLSDI